MRINYVLLAADIQDLGNGQRAYINVGYSFGSDVFPLENTALRLIVCLEWLPPEASKHMTVTIDVKRRGGPTLGTFTLQATGPAVVQRDRVVCTMMETTLHLVSFPAPGAYYISVAAPSGGTRTINFEIVDTRDPQTFDA